MPLEQDLDICQRKEKHSADERKNIYKGTNKLKKKKKDETLENQVTWLGYSIKMARNNDQNMSGIQRNLKF